MLGQLTGDGLRTAVLSVVAAFVVSPGGTVRSGVFRTEAVSFHQAEDQHDCNKFEHVEDLEIDRKS